MTQVGMLGHSLIQKITTEKRDVPIFRILNQGLMARFWESLRRDGLRMSLIRTRGFLGRQLGLKRYTNRPEAYLDGFWADIAKRGAFQVSAAPATLTRKRKLAMIGDLDLPQCRKYRVAQLGELMASIGVDYGFSHYRDVPRSVSLMQDATHLMFYRTRADAQMTMYLHEARRLRLPIAYDLDDPLFSVEAYETYQNMKALPARMKRHFLAEAPAYLAGMTQADLITVSTPAMVELTQSLLPRPVYLRRNFADADSFAAARAALQSGGRRPGAPFRVGFASGSKGHEIDFALIGDDLIRFLQGASDRQLVILGHFDKKHLPKALLSQVEIHPFRSYDRYLSVLSSLDAAVMPLTDDLFNRCKSAVRVLDAAAVAVPSLVGQVSDMAHVVQDGQTGRVLAPGASWCDALEEMAGDRAATTVMGQAAAEDLKARWSIDETPSDQIIAPEIVRWLKA